MKNIKPKQDKAFYFSIDVDYVRGSESGVLDLINFSKTHNLHTSFFITGKFAEQYPNVTGEIYANSYDIGIHGWDHGTNNSGENFRTNSYDEQRWRIEKTMLTIEGITGKVPTMNRCPNLWINENTLRILEELGFKIDSSVPSRRLAGRIRSLKYFFAPLSPYRPSSNNLGKKGSSKIIEVPPAAYYIPINLSALRKFGLKTLKPFIRALSRKSSTLLFYGHPAEYVEFSKLQFDFPVVKRHAENIGPEVFDLTSELIEYIRALGYTSQKLSHLEE